MQENMWFAGHEVELPEMLAGREARVALQQEMLARYPETVLVCFTLNIAGPVKVFPLAEEGFVEGCTLLEQAFSNQLAAKEIRYHAYGYEAFYAVADDALEVKRKTAEIEETHPAGRLFDIDVLRRDGTKVSRSEIGYPARRCLICGEPAADCAGSRRHSVPELQETTADLLVRFLGQEPERLLGRIVQTALLLEVYTTPKPGLVDLENTGSHKDMDVPLFEKSARALVPYFRECYRYAKAHRSDTPEALLNALRPIGKKAEETMLAATGGVNTHKGAVYSFGILCAAIGRSGLRGEEELLEAAAGIGRCALSDFDVLEQGYRAEQPDHELSAGEAQYMRYGTQGIRGEVAAGFPAVAQIGLPVFREMYNRGYDWNTAGVFTLLYLISEVADSNMVKRGGPDLQRKMQLETKHLLSFKSVTMDMVRVLDDEFVWHNMSPGGCADLLAVVYFLILICHWI